MTKITITYEVDSLAKAHEIIAAVENATKQPYRQHGYGANQMHEADPEIGFGVGDETPPSPEERPNISPGEPSITKIGSDNKTSLLNAVTDGIPIHPKWAEHMKLLWKRNEVKFDGKEYYV